MTSPLPSRLFVSYSHTDISDMLIFRKHLSGMLLNKTEVWSDRDISKGTDWDCLLKSNLKLANSALIIATPDYLVSSWCRDELQQLSSAKRAGSLRNLFWVQLKPCGWQHTELREFQAFGTELAIDEFPDETQRQRAILKVCEQIASEIVSSITKQDKDLAFVRRLILNANYNVTLNNVIRPPGPFSIVCLGFDGSINIVVKVLKWIPLEGLTDTLVRVGNKRKQLANPCFVKMYDIFSAGDEGEKRTVLVSEYIGNTSPSLRLELSENSDKKKPFPIGKVVRLIRRMAEGLWELHQQDASEHEWEHTFGLLTPDHIFYDPLAERLRVSPIGVSSFLWHVLHCDIYGDWVDPKSKVYVAPEQPDSPAMRLTPLTDQYMLGRLGVELLEGMCFEQILNGERREQFWEKPERFIRGTWKEDRKHLWTILKKMLEKEPKDRFANMGEVVRKLFVLEEEGRALASWETRSARQILPVFVEQFYANFFKTSPESKTKFDSVDVAMQHKKLIMAMATISNSKPGNKSISLDHILEKHRGKGITNDEFRKFQKSFLSTLDNFGSEELQKEWDDLITRVTDRMISECVEGGPDSLNADQPPLDNKVDVARETLTQEKQVRE